MSDELERLKSENAALREALSAAKRLPAEREDRPGDGRPQEHRDHHHRGRPSPGPRRTTGDEAMSELDLDTLQRWAATAPDSSVLLHVSDALALIALPAPSPPCWSSFWRC
jgi:hypothetical protein